MSYVPPATVTARDRQQPGPPHEVNPSGLTFPQDGAEACDRQLPSLAQPLEIRQRPDGSSMSTARDLQRRTSPSRTSHDPSPSSQSPPTQLAPLAPPIPTLPLSIDAISAPPTQSATSPPPSPHHISDPHVSRLRRSARRSPNARSERSAPSSIATSTFSDLPARSIGRRGSLPALNPVRNRASSHSPTPHATGTGEVSGLRARRHLDPDQHWLSEDEATGSVGGTPAARQRSSAARRRSGFGSDDDHHLDSRKQQFDEMIRSRLHRTSHEIHHRPSKIVVDASSMPLETQQSDSAYVAVVLSRLVELLTCPHCHDLLNDPVTFGCGHTRCKACPVTNVVDIQQPSVIAPVLTSSPSSSTHAPFPSPSKDRTNPLAMYLPGTFPAHLPLSSPPAPRDLSGTPVPVQAPTCGIPSCRHAEYSPLPTAWSTGPKTDYNVRKILDHVRRAIAEPAFSSLVSSPPSSTPIQQPDPSMLHAKEKGPARMPSDSSGSSGSSGGGEEQVKGGHDGKRAHKSRSNFKSVKVAKTRRLSESAIADEETTPSSSFTPRETDVPSSRKSDHLSTVLNDVQAECECQVCVQLFHDPITSPCGHSFCQKCLARACDHSSKCPLCRTDLPPLAYFHRERPNIALRSIVVTAFPVLAADRANSIREEELALLANVPIFVCTSAWPGIPTFLHIFEPRYRLMIRRALESPSREFGMVLPNRDGLGGVNSYGTMLKITNCSVMEDGRSIVQCVGTWRFKLVERWMVDGYNVARVERVDDVSLEQELELEQAALRRNQHEFSEFQDPDSTASPPLTSAPSRPPMTGNMELPMEQLMQICLDFIRTLRSQSAPWVIERLDNTVGEMPTSPAEFTWWCGEVMPVEDHVKVVLLSITSVRERLRLIVFWIEQFRSSWWYSRGCNLM